MNRHIKTIIILVLITITCLSIGYSAYNTSLNIDNINAKIRLKKNIRITSFSIDSTTSNATSNYEEYNVNQISSQINLPNADSSITFKVEITNIESAEMGLLKIDGINNELEYSITNYNLKDKICNNGSCNLGVTKDIYITVKYKEGMYNSANTTFNLNLLFDFRQVFTITYSGITDVSSYPAYILQGETLTVTFQNVTGITIQETTNYTFSNSTLIVNDVSSNLTITLTAYEEKDFVVQGDGENITLTAPDITTDSPVTIDQMLEKTFAGVNATNKVITRIDVITTYTTTTGSDQNVNCNLKLGETTQTKQITFLGKQTNGTVTTTFDNLNIGTDSTFDISYSTIKLTNHDINISNKEIIFYLSDAS